MEYPMNIFYSREYPIDYLFQIQVTLFLNKNFINFLLVRNSIDPIFFRTMFIKFQSDFLWICKSYLQFTLREPQSRDVTGLVF